MTATPDVALAALRRALFLVAFPMVFLSFALPLRARELGASGVELGILYSLFTAALLVFRPLVGIGIDRFGRRPFLLAALALHAATSGLYAITDSLAGLYAGRLMQGTGVAFLLITADALVADVTASRERAAAMGANMERQARGGMVGATLGFGLVGALPLYAWRISFTTFALVSLLALAFAWRGLPESRAPRVPGSDATPFRVTGRLRRLIAVAAAAALAGGMIQPFYLVYLQERFGLDLRALAVVFVPVGFVYALLPSRIGRWTRDWPRARAMAAGLAAAGAMYATVPVLPGVVAIVAAFVGASAGTVLVELTRNAWVADLAPPDATGRAFGAMELTAGIGASLGPLLGGVVLDRFGGFGVFTAGAGMYLVAAGVLAAGYVGRHRPRD